MLGGKPVVVRPEYTAESGLPAAGPEMKFQFVVQPRGDRDEDGGGVRLGD